MSENECLGIELDLFTNEPSFQQAIKQLEQLHSNITRISNSITANNPISKFSETVTGLQTNVSRLNAAMGDTSTSRAYANSFSQVNDSIKKTAEAVKTATSEITKSLSSQAAAIKSINDQMKSSSNGGGLFNNSQLNQSQAALNGLHQTLGDISKRLIEFYAIRTGIFFLSSEIGRATKQQIEFNQALHDTAAITQATTAEMGKLSSAAMAIAKNSKFSPSEVMHSMKTLGQAGVSAAELPAVAQTTDMFATGTGSTPEQAAKLLTTAMNVWGIAAERAGRISNTMTAALNASKLEVGQLGTAFNYLANQSSIFGLSLEQTTGIIATLANQGVNASTIGTSVSQLMVKLAAPSDKFRALLKEYSIGLDEIAPRAHNFADIVARFEKAAIPAERILAALDVRVGRALVAALQAGSDKFQLMESRITNTNAAATAYAEAMKGVSAQINVLRGEGIQTLDQTLQNLGVSFTQVRESVQNLLVGLRSSEGQFLLFSGAVIASFAAITKAVQANPVLASVSLALSGITAGVAKLGEANRATSQAIDEATHKSTEQSAEYQRKSAALYEMLGLIDKNKTTEQGYLEVQGESQKKLRQLMNDFPEFFKGMDIKRLKYEQLVKVIKDYNAARSLELKHDISLGNQQADTINELKQQLRDSQQIEANKENNHDLFNFQQFKTGDLTEQLKLAEEAYSKFVAANLAHRNDVEVYLDDMGTKRTRQVTPAPDKPKSAAVTVPEKTKHAVKSPEERAEDTISRLTEDQKDVAERLRYEQAKINRELAELKLKDKLLSETEYHERELAAVKLLDEEYEKKRLQERTTAFTKLAKALSGSYEPPSDSHPSGLVTYDKRFNSEQVNQLIQQTNRNLNTQAMVVDAASKQKELERIRQLGIKPATAPQLISGAVERAADRELSTRTQALKLSEKQVWTAEELQRLQLAETLAAIRNTEQKKAAYEADLQALGDRQALTREEQSTYDSIEGKLSAIVEKQRELNVLKQEQQTANIASSFLEGFRSSFVELSNTHKLMQSAGSNLTTQAVNGLSGAVNDSFSTVFNPDRGKIAALNQDIAAKQKEKQQLESDIRAIEGNTNKTPQELKTLSDKKIALDGVNHSLAAQRQALQEQTNAWATFQKGMQKFATGIISELQRIISQMIAVKLIGATIGLFAGGVPSVASASGDSYGVLQSDANAPTTGWTPPTFANGGMVNGLAGGYIPKLPGTQWGVDGVPTLTAPGEIIIRRDSVQALGADNLLYMNETGKLPHFANGGMVGSKGTSSSNGFSHNTENQELTLVINNIADVSSIPQAPINAQEVVNIVSFNAQQRGTIHKVFRQIAAGN